MSQQTAKHIVIDARNRRSSTGRYTDRLIEYLQKLDHNNTYTVLVQPDDPWQPSVENFKPAPCEFEQFSFNPLDQIKFARQVYRLKPDLVHFTMTQQPIFYFGNIVTTTHDLTMLRFTRPSRFSSVAHKIGMVMYRFLFWLSHRKLKKIIVPSNFVAEDLADYEPFTKKKLVVTYESSEPPIAEPALKLANISKPFIFHVGSPFPHKNIDRLIKAFEILHGKQPALKLILPGKIKDQFKADLDSWVAASPAKEAIIIPGFVSDAELKWLYENAAAYVLPSLSEGFGLPGLEAMAHGTPLVSSKATCLPEIYGEAAHYFDPTNIEDMAAKIGEVLDDNNLRDQLVKAGQQQIKKYSWDKMAEQTLEVYNSVLSK